MDGQEESGASEEVESLYIRTSEDNTQSLMDLIRQFTTIKDFLCDDSIHLSVSPTTLSNLEQSLFLDFAFDIDGVVVELEGLSGLKLPVPYLTFPKPSKATMRPVFHLLKKHIRSNNYSRLGFRCFQLSRGISLAKSQGWQLSLCLIPRGHQGDTSIDSAAKMDQEALERFRAIAETLQRLLKSVPTKDMKRPTMQKNRLYDLSHFNILKQDQDFFFDVFDRALQSQPIDCLKPIIILCQFGQKDRSHLNLSELCYERGFRCISIHAACEIGSLHENIHHFWSKYALEDLVGNKGSIFCPLSLREALNFQTNLDGQCMEISNDLLSTVMFPKDITFLQLYADTPHNRLESWFSHPVSGEVVCCGLMHPVTTRAMSNRSETYFSHMQDLLLKLQGIVKARIEIVTLLGTHQISGIVSAVNFFNVRALSKLLEDKPMLLPFAEDQPRLTFLSTIKDVPRHLLESLQAAHASGKHKGKFKESWVAFQAEMALEVFFWGRTGSMHDSILAVNLGPALDNERSLTWQRGIMGLAPFNSAAVDMAPPPLLYWSKNDLQTTRIQRLFGFADSFEAANTVIGTELLRLILCDLGQTTQVSVMNLANVSPPAECKCTGTISREQLLEELVEKINRFTFPSTARRAAQLLEEHGKPLRDILRSALAYTSIQYFPAMKVIDSARNPKVSWNKKDMLNVLAPQQNPSPDAVAAALEGDVIVNLVSRGLTYERNLASAKANGMPWMKHVLARLNQEKMDRTQLVQVCTFVSCLALMKQSIYIDYGKLAMLASLLPISQHKLKMLQIQSPILYEGLVNPKIWRLHHTIPFKITPIITEKPKVTHKAPLHVTVGEELQPEEEIEEGQVPEVISHTPSMALPAGMTRRWTPRELDLAYQARTREGCSVNSAPDEETSFFTGLDSRARGRFPCGQVRSRSEDLDQILQPFWPEKSDARERLSERQKAFFNYMMDQLKVKDRRDLQRNAKIVQCEGVSRGVWEEDWAPEDIKTSFQKSLKTKRTYVTGAETSAVNQSAASSALFLFRVTQPISRQSRTRLKMSSSEENDLDLSVEEVIITRINCFEKFAVAQISDLQQKQKNLEESMNDKMPSDMAAVKADLSALRSRVEAQDQQIGEIKRILEEKATSGPSHSEVQRKRSAPSPDWTPEQKRSRSEDLDQILQPFWPEKSDARERLSERQQAFFNYMMDQLKVKDRRDLQRNAKIVQCEGVSRGVWEEDWAPEDIKTSFQKYLEEKLKNYVKKLIKRTAEETSDN
ncbi:unnamed protein product [Leuciscus chuanchicus]